MSDKPKVSVIIPVYNTQKYLEICLDSVINQTYNNLEIIIINDASPDDSQILINNYAKKDPRIVTLVHSQNNGLYQTRISGIMRANGTYIMHLDSDDWLSLDSIRRLVHEATNTNADITALDHVLYMEDSQEYRVEPLNKIEFDYLESPRLQEIFYANLGLRYTWHIVSGKLYKAAIWKDNLELFRTDLKINLWAPLKIQHWTNHNYSITIQ